MFAWASASKALTKRKAMAFEPLLRRHFVRMITGAQPTGAQLNHEYPSLYPDGSALGDAVPRELFSQFSVRDGAHQKEVDYTYTGCNLRSVVDARREASVRVAQYIHRASGKKGAAISIPADRIGKILFSPSTFMRGLVPGALRSEIEVADATEDQVKEIGKGIQVAIVRGYLQVYDAYTSNVKARRQMP